MNRTEPSDDRYEVLDERGHKTDKILDHRTVHQQGLWHSVVNVWIINSKGEILMQLRGPEVELAPSVWDVAIGSHLRVGEDPVDAALRALQHGLGVVVAPEDLKHLFNIQCANPMPNGTAHKVMGHIFLVQRDIDFGELTYDRKKIVKFAWVSPIVLMSEVGNQETKTRYFPRANNYYTKLFEALQGLLPASV